MSAHDERQQTLEIAEKLEFDAACKICAMAPSVRETMMAAAAELRRLAALESDGILSEVPKTRGQVQIIGPN